MSTPPIAIFGANARFNYGDLIFPLILKRALDAAGCDRPIETIGMRASDLSRYGARPTHAVRWLADPDNMPDGSKLIIAGGEVLAAGWGRLFSHLLPQRGGDQIFSVVSKILSERRLDRLGQRGAKVGWPIPLCPSSRHFARRVEVIFNAVGGSGLAGRPEEWRAEVRRALRGAAYASVRDEATFDAVGGAGSGVELHPDCAALVADLFPRDWLRDRCRPAAGKIIGSGAPYICFQLHRYFTAAKLRAFAGELDRLHARDGVRIVLLPLGRATGHSDQVALTKVRRAMSAPAELPPDLGVFDIMALLAHSAAFAGTSLHGLITAMSYGRPFALLGKNPKCLSFAGAWAPGQFAAPLKAKGLREGVLHRLGAGRAPLTDAALALREAAAAGVGRLVAVALDQPQTAAAPGLTRRGARRAGARPGASPVQLLR